MNISVFSIRRPAAATVVSLLIVLLGAVGASFLGVRQFPNVDPPNITVTTSYTGANADVIESQITEPLEESINGIDGIKSLTSSSSDGRSTITVEFELGRDLEQAANDVRDRVERSKRQLPQDVDPPVVAKADANGNAILVMTVQSRGRTLNELSAYAANVLKERLQTITGVGSITIWGERKYAMRVVMDPSKLAGYGLTSTDVRTALQRENVELPAGRIEGDNTELSLRTLGRLISIEQFEQVILRATPDGSIRLVDVARVYLGAENERTILKRDGVAMVALAISPQPGANQVDISDEFQRRYADLKANVPSDIALDVAFDTTDFIRAAILEVQETIVIAFVLVVLIIFLFLRSFRATFIPVIAIPVSLISSFFFLWIFGFSINLLTLLGVVLATGLVVDDAIVMMENIYKRIERGESNIEAGERGSSEITFAIISTTITLAVVFLPIIFLQGITGQLFREFGVVLASSILVSALVSLTLTPMMSAKLLRPVENEGILYRATEPAFQWMTSTYGVLAATVMRRSWIAVVAMIIAVGTIIGVGALLKSELAPLEDRSAMTVTVTAPEGTTYDRMNVIMDSIRTTVERAVPERKLVLTVTSPFFLAGGANGGFSRVLLNDPETRNRTQMQIARKLTAQMKNESAARAVVIQEQTISTVQRAGLPVQVVLLANKMEQLRARLPDILDVAQKDPTLSVVDVNLKFTKPELVIEIDRGRARELGVSAADIASVIQAGLSGQRFGYITRDGKQYQVIGELERTQRSTPEDVRQLSVRSQSGELVPLADLVLLRENSVPPQLYRYNRSSSATISAGLAPGATIADGIKAMEGAIKSVVGDELSTTLTGSSRDFRESSSSLLFAFIVSLVLVYLILAAQFESWVDPLTIMLTVPLALSGAVLSLWFAGETLNIFSQIGCIALIGLVTKNGILIVEFANQQREHGATWTEAALASAQSRFRPILMTSLATILGAAPIAFSLGAASTSRMGLGVAVVGGMFIATFLTLLVLPSLYVLLSKLKRTSAQGDASPLTTVLVLVALVTGATPASAQTLSMADAVKSAIENNGLVRIAKLDSTAASLRAMQSHSVYLPTADVQSSATRGANNVAQTTVSGVVINRDNAGFTNMNAAAVMQWTLFDGFRMYAVDDQFALMAQSERERARGQFAAVIADVMTRYATAIVARHQIDDLRAALALADKRLSIISLRKDIGSASGTQLSQARIDRNAIASMMRRAETSYANARIALYASIGESDTASAILDTNITTPSLPDLESLLTELSKRNPELVSAELAVDAAKARERELNAAFWPRLDLTGGYQYTNNTTEAGFILDNRTTGWNAGLTLRYNLFRGQSDKAASELARVETQRRQILVEEGLREQRSRITQAYERFRQGIELLSIERESYQAAQKNAAAALVSFEQGLVYDIEVRQAQQTALDAALRIAQLEHETFVSAVEALRISGTLVW
ncbi:MAG: AcrB/AcrD/AcrF family protein [Ignavibacteria bacterium]|nr:AcrB/AcrD/AcrF family protein [Ignavibacteria bacterium]